MERHPLALTQTIVGLQVKRDLFAKRDNSREHTEFARILLALLPLVEGELAPEYRAWIYMEAGRNLAAVAEPDALAVERMIANAFGEPHKDGAARSQEPHTLRYAAQIHALMGRGDAAKSFLEKAMNGERDTFRAHILMARIEWAGGESGAAQESLDRAASVAEGMPEQNELLATAQSVRELFAGEWSDSPRLAVR